MKKTFICLLLILASAVFPNAQARKRVLKPVSFTVVNVQPTTVITNEPLTIRYRLEYLLPISDKEVKILDVLDAKFFQNALGTPVDVDFKALKDKYGDNVNALKIDVGAHATVSDFVAEKEELAGDKLRRDFIVTLKVIREKVTKDAIPVSRLEFPEVSVPWAVARLGQKEGEYDHEDPVKSQKVRINHVLTTPTHDPTVNFRTAVIVPQYSGTSIFWSFWGIPAFSVLFVGVLALAMVRTFRRPIYAAANKSIEVAGQSQIAEVSGVRRLEFRYARAQLWSALTSIYQSNSTTINRNELVSDFYKGLYNLLLAAVPSAPVGSLPNDFIKALANDHHKSAPDKVLQSLAESAEKLRPTYESLSDSKIDILKFNAVAALAISVKPTVKELWFLNRFISSLKHLFGK